MKKKNIAMMMAGVTVASAVAPVFAAQQTVTGAVTVNVAKGKEIAAQLRKDLAVTYQEVKAGKTVGEKVFAVEIVKQGTTEAVANASVLEEKIAALQNGQSLTFKVTDKGHEMVDGKVVDYTTSNYKNASEIIDDIDTYNQTPSASTLEYKTSVSGEYVEVKRKDVKEDFVKIDANAKKLNFSKAILENGKLKGFELQYDEAVKFETTITVKNTNEVAVADLFDGVRLTQKGTELLNAIEDAKTNANLDINITSGNIFLSQTSGSVTTNSTTEDIIDPGFTQGQKAYFEMEITTTKSTVAKKETITVSDADQFLVRDLYDMLKGESTQVKSLIGDTRFTTAVEVSKQSFDDGNANSVVLVGEDAIVDGLAAAPLAKQVTGSILLTKQNELPAETEAEMTRILGNNMSGKTIYLVGGESKISKDLEAKLKKTGANIVRLAGDTRFETSLEIAEEMAKTATATTAYVVGGNGEADAMSISAYAAQTNAPVVVVDKNEVSEETMEFLDGKNIEIVGGTGVVSEEVEAQLKEIDADNKVVRIAGQTRQETNAKVINAKYADAEKAYVAKDGYVGGNGKLIDALAVAPLAAKDNAPIILTTNDLTVAQQEAVEANLKSVEELTQVGGGVIDSAIKMIVKLIKG